MSESLCVFDRATVRRHRDRAARSFQDHDFLVREAAERLADRLDDIKRSFPLALDLGCHTGQLSRRLAGRGGIETLVHCDLSPAMVAQAPAPRLVVDEEALPFAPACFDLVMSCLSLHWVNDLPGTLVQIRTILKPDGLFVAAMLGGETLKELRRALTEAEATIEGGLSPRVSPFADVRDAGNLLQRAGFALPVADADTLTVLYDSPLRLMADLRDMGESNAIVERRKGLTQRTTILEACRRYAQSWTRDDGGVPATFQIVYLTAWVPDTSQPKPLRPGSASARLADALGAREGKGPDETGSR